MNTYQLKDFLEMHASFAPSFNHDGTKVAFLSNETGSNQLYVVSSKGGKPEQLTSFEDPIDFAFFSPTKDEILFGKSLGGNELVQLHLYSFDSKTVRDLSKNPAAKYSAGTFSSDGKRISVSHNERNGKDFDVGIMDLETGNVEIVFNQGGACQARGFSPKDSFLLIRRALSGTASDLFLVNLADKSVEQITPFTGKSFFGGASWLPDESAFFTITDKDRDFLGLAKYSISERAFTYAHTPEWDIDGAFVSKDGTKIGLLTNVEGYLTPSLYEVATLKQIPLPQIPAGSSVFTMKFSRDSKSLAMCVGSSRLTNDIWVLSLDEGTFARLTMSHQSVPEAELVEPELFRYRSFDGLEVPAFLYRPKGDSKKVPVVIHIHGGPESQYQPTMAALNQYLVHHGYAVIAPNVRGSRGYGKKYLALDDVEKRLDSVKDLVSLHAHIQTMSGLDGSKISLKGGSYGGYMTLAGLAFYPDLWAGGVDTVGIANLVTFLENTAPYRRKLREAEYGSLEHHRELLKAFSPIHKASDIKAPLLVIHGANDPRVPLGEAIQITDSLKALGRKAELIVYDDEGHGLSKLKNKLDAYPKIIDFLDECFAKPAQGSE